MRSGFIFLPSTTGVLGDVGKKTGWWISLNSVNNEAYAFSFNNIGTSFGLNVYWHGFPLRCLSTV